ncbi:MAG: hypothetical protein WC333_03765 [Dehalococcoidia bacterium]|jgi:hypothetical protein
MKKMLGVLGIAVLALAMVMAASLPALAAKPAGNLAGAQKIDWNLSSEVMPVPPYGAMDIPGSDTASKLIVNQPNGKTKAAITGSMDGLNPNTTYTVYLSKGYTPYTPVNVIGTYTWLVLSTYSHDLFITQQNPDGTFSGTGGYPAGAATYATTETITGKVTGNQITFTTKYAGPYNPGYTATASETIAADGSMSGNSPWEWHTTSGAATPASGSTGWPGLFTSTVQPFTFTTDADGAGCWHINLTAADFPAGGPDYQLSVWINKAGRTILISDTFSVTIN